MPREFNCYRFAKNSETVPYISPSFCSPGHWDCHWCGRAVRVCPSCRTAPGPRSGGSRTWPSGSARQTATPSRPLSRGSRSWSRTAAQCWCTCCRRACRCCCRVWGRRGWGCPRSWWREYSAPRRRRLIASSWRVFEICHPFLCSRMSPPHPAINVNCEISTL